MTIIKTVAKLGQYQLEIKKSKFIAHLFPIYSEEEAQNHIQKIRSEHRGANHNVYAYVLGNEGEIQRASDDGEPSGTAGKPILQLLVNNGITNTLVVVTRYFGGILLGTGGLIRAYTQSAQEAFGHIGLIELVKGQIIQVQLNYHQLATFEYILGLVKAEVITKQFTERIDCQIWLKDDKVNSFKELMESRLGPTLLQLLGTEYR